MSSGTSGSERTAFFRDAALVTIRSEESAFAVEPAYLLEPRTGSIRKGIRRAMAEYCVRRKHPVE